MSAFKGTPGPWTFQPDDRFELIAPSVLELEDDAACGDPECCGQATYWIEVSREDGQLMAAAPELLEACEIALSFVGAWAGAYQQSHNLAELHPRHAAAIAQIGDAIDKATGGQP